MASLPDRAGWAFRGRCRAVSEHGNVRSKLPATGERTTSRPGLERSTEVPGRSCPPLARARRRSRGWSGRPEYPVEAIRCLRAHDAAAGYATPGEAFDIQRVVMIVGLTVWGVSEIAPESG